MKKAKLIFDYIEFFLKVIGEVLWGSVASIEENTAQNRGIPCKNLKDNHNYLIILNVLSLYGSLSHHSKVHKVDI